MAKQIDPKVKTETEAELVLEALKLLLKQRKKTYRDLAQYLKLSLPSVKRAMNSKSLPLKRVEEICQFLEISLFELLSLARTNAGQEFWFTEEQETFFAEHHSHLAYFFEVIERSPSEIEKKYNLSRRSSLQYLKKLEQMELLELQPGDRVKTRVRGPVMWDDHGVLGQVFSRLMIINMAEHISSKLGKPGDALVDLAGWKLSPEEYSKMKAEYAEFASRYRQISSFNKRAKRREASLNISAIMLADEWKDPFRMTIKEFCSSESPRKNAR